MQYKASGRSSGHRLPALVPALRIALLAALVGCMASDAWAQADWITGPRGVPSSTGFEFFDVFNPAMLPEKILWTADRPARTPRPTTLPKQVAQLETGYQYRYRDHAEVIRTSHLAPNLLYRYAPLGALELRVGWTYAWETVDARAGSVERSGSDDVSIGAKLLLTTQESGRPEQALLFETLVPTGGSPLAGDEVGFALDYLVGWTFANCWSVFGSTGLETLSESNDSFTAAHQSIAVAAPLGDRTQIVFEYVGRYSNGRADEFNEQSIDLAAAWQATEALQFDLLVGLGLSDDADDFFAAVGGVLRF